jgi:hypothetical protein
MRVEIDGHLYDLEKVPEGKPDEKPPQIRFASHEEQIGLWAGVTTQEILRVLIDRTWYCDTCLPSHLNDYIVHHLRMALVLHEARALIRKTEDGKIKPECIGLDRDGHFSLTTSSEKPSWYAKEPRKRDTDTGGPKPGEVAHCAKVREHDT